MLFLYVIHAFLSHHFTTMKKYQDALSLFSGTFVSMYKRLFCAILLKLFFVVQNLCPYLTKTIENKLLKSLSQHILYEDCSFMLGIYAKCYNNNVNIQVSISNENSPNYLNAFPPLNYAIAGTLIIIIMITLFWVQKSRNSSVDYTFKRMNVV